MIKYDTNNKAIQDTLAKLQTQETGGTKVDPLIWSAIIGAVVSIGSMVFNGVQADKASKQNQENQETQWAREDAELQRGLADAQKAGFSPSAVLGQSWQSSLSTQHSGINIDPSSLVNSVSQAGQGLSRQKQQQPYLDAQIADLHESTRSKTLSNESLELENKYKEQELKDKAIERTLDLIQRRKNNDITEAQYRVLLGDIATQYGNQNVVKELISHRVDQSDYRADNYQGEYKNRETESNIKNTDKNTDLQEAQRLLANAESFYTSTLNTIANAQHKEWSGDFARRARTALYESQRAIQNYQAYIYDWKKTTASQRGDFSIPVDIDLSDGSIKYNVKNCTYAEYLNYWDEFLGRSGALMQQSSDWDKSMQTLDQIWKGTGSLTGLSGVLNNLGTRNETTSTKRQNSSHSVNLRK